MQRRSLSMCLFGLFLCLCCSFGSVSSLEIVSLTNISSTSLKVQWKEKFYDGSTSIPKYRVLFHLANCSTHLKDDSIFQNVTLNTTGILHDNSTQLSHTISNLSRWSFYQVKVLALFENGTVFGNISETKCERTSEDAPTAAPVNLTVVNKSSSSLEVNWSAPPIDRTHGHIRHYLIRYWEKQCSDSNVTVNATIEEKTVGPSNYSVLLDGLKYWKCYQVNVTAVTVGEGPYVADVETRTSEEAPGAAPLNLVVTNTSSTRLNASWNAPPWDLTYGYIRYYIIKYLEVQCSGYSYGAVKSTARNKTVGGDVNSVMLENLDVWKCYQVNVTAYTVGEGPYATVEETRTSEEAPKAAPSNLTVENISSTSLKATWSAPPSNETFGYIRYYLIKYLEVNCSRDSYGNVDETIRNVTVRGDVYSVILDSLAYWKCYQVNVTAFTVGEGPYAVEAETRTSENAPTAPPGNLKVFNISSTSLNATWSAPPIDKTHGHIRYYLIKYREVQCSNYSKGTEVENETVNEKTVESNVHSVTLNGLRFWKCYQVNVTAVTVGEGPYARIRESRTSENAPTAAPVDLIVVNQSSTSLEARWSAPPINETNGIIRHYVIKYREVECSNYSYGNVDGTTKDETVRGDVYSVILDSLAYWKCYQVNVTAVTVSEGPYATDSETRTSENAPTAAPVNLNVVNVSSTSLQATWSAPPINGTHGHIRHYFIKYWGVQCSEITNVTVNGTIQEKTVGPNNFSVMLDGLQFWKCYQVNVTAFTVGEGPYATDLKTRTSENAPTAPPGNLIVFNTSSTSLNATWSAPPIDKTHGHIRFYLIKYREVNCSRDSYGNVDETIRNVTVRGDVYSVILDSLAYWKCYQVNVTAVTVGEGPYATDAETRTSENVPTAPPGNLKVFNISSTSLNATWSAPPIDKTHGHIRFYLIKYWEVRCSDFFYDSHNLTVVTKTVASTLRSVIVDGLDYWKCYQVNITAVTVGEGPYATDIETRTTENAPTAAPVNLTVVNMSSSSLQASWSRPPINETHGHIRHYVIKYWEVQCSKYWYGTVDGTVQKKTVGSNNHSAIIAGLKYWKCYQVNVTAVTVGEGPYATDNETRTSENAPTAMPSGLNVSNKSSTSLEATWSRPPINKTHGHIRHYLLKYWEVQCSKYSYGTVNGTVKEKTIGANNHSAIIDGLKYWKCYQVDVTAFTVGEGPYAMDAETRTSENAPTAAPPGLTVLNKSSTSLEVNWTKPPKNDTHGYIRHYLIKYWEVQCSTHFYGSPDGAIRNRTVGWRNHSVILAGLKFWKCYQVNVTAFTVGEGPFATDNETRTSENAPTAAPVGLNVVNKSSSILNATWSAPPIRDTHGIIRHYLIKYREVKCSKYWYGTVDGTMKEKTVGSNLHSVILDKLKLWKCYQVNVTAVTVDEGPYATGSETRTSENAPTAIPSGLNVFNISSRSLQANWTAPPIFETHGHIRYYLIKYREVQCSEYWYGTVDGTVKEKMVESSNNSATLDGLRFWKCYQVNITAVTVREGPYAIAAETRTSENAPTKPPVITSLYFVNSTSLNIAWNAPADVDRHGFIRRFEIFVAKGNCSMDLPTTPTSKTSPEPTTTKTDDGLATEKPSTEPLRRRRRSIGCNFESRYNVPGKATHKLISDLKKWTIYSVYVVCWTVGPSHRSDINVSRTDEDRPGRPLNLKCRNEAPGTIGLTWNKPLNPYGIITGYEVTWNATNDPKSHETSTLTYSVKNLETYTVYKFILKARTKKGLSESTSCTRRTIAEKPSKPENLMSTVHSPYQINLSWQRPLAPNGEIFGYEVETFTGAVGSNTWLKTKKTGPQEHTAIIKGLKPHTVYTFKVKCDGTENKSDPAVVTNTTETTSPPPITGTPIPATIYVQKGHEVIAVRLERFSDQSGKIDYYVIIVFDLANGKPRDSSKYKTSDLLSYDECRKKNCKDPYITAFFKADYFPANGIFYIGNGTKSDKIKKRNRRSTNQEKYYNAPLQPEHSYKFFYRGCVSDLKCQSSEWSKELRTGVKPTLPPTSIVGPVVGSVVGILVLFLIIAALILYRRRHPEKEGWPLSCLKANEKEKGEEEEELRVQGQENPGFDVGGPIRKETFEAHCSRMRQNQGYQFSEQFKIIQSVPRAPAEHSLNELNRESNRYTNIVAYDHTRVKLRNLDGLESDYINANYIDGYEGAATYIACQGPLDHTREHFWRMVWEQDISVIVMVTRVEEGGRIKCSQYWPLSGSMKFESMQVFTSESTQLPDYNITTLNILNSREPGKERFVRHFHFYSWPDHGVPAFADAMLSFIRRVNENTPPDGGPTLVHCSAGVGRTGTYIMLDVCLKRLAAENVVDPFNFLRKIRSQRNFMVQTEVQYVFIHEAILELIKCGKTELLAKDLRDYIKTLKTPITQTEIFLDREFQFLNEYSQTTDHDFKAASAACNKTKNRFFTVLPFDSTRVQLRVIPGIQGSDYINASYIDGYMKEKAFIATQAPLQNTVDDFWRMIWEQHSLTVACLIQDSETARTKMHIYWPDDLVQKCGPLLIEKVSEQKQADFIVRDFKFTNSQRGNSRIVRHFQYTSWPDNGSPANGAGIVDYIGQIQKWQQQNGDHVIVVHCSTGVGRTGVFIALCNLIERVKTEGLLDVFRVVRRLKTQRPGMVQTKGQYMFCYIALQDYLASFDIYSNFM